MKKLIAIILVVMVLAAVVVQPAAARSTACDALNNSVTNSFSQAWNYIHCVGDNVALAWELMFAHW